MFMLAIRGMSVFGLIDPIRASRRHVLISRLTGYTERLGCAESA
jgi:hypothetical protein